MYTVRRQFLRHFPCAIVALSATLAPQAAKATSIKDLDRLKGQERNVHAGMGLVVGLNGTVVKVHGSASARVVANALRQVAESASQHLNERIQEAIHRVSEPVPVSA